MRFFYHIRITIKDDLSDCIELDLSKQKLNNQIIKKLNLGTSFLCGEDIVEPSNIKSIRISRTEVNSSHILPLICEERNKSKVNAIGISDEWYVVKKGQDVTRDFIKDTSFFSTSIKEVKKQSKWDIFWNDSKYKSLRWGLTFLISIIALFGIGTIININSNNINTDQYVNVEGDSYFYQDGSNITNEDILQEMNLGFELKHEEWFNERFKDWDLSIDVLENDLESGNYIPSVMYLNLTTEDKLVNAEVNFDLGVESFNNGSYFEALDYFEISISYVNYSNAWLLKGKTHFFLEQYDEALESFNKMTLFNNESTELWQHIGETNFFLLDYESALFAFDKVIELDYNSFFAWYDKGIIYHNIENYEFAVDSLLIANEIIPNDEEILKQLGIDYYALNDYSETIFYLTKLNDFDEITAPILAFSFYKEGNYSLSSDYFSIALNYDENNIELLNGKAISLMKLGWFNDSLFYLDEALNINSDISDIWKNKCISLFMLNIFEEESTCEGYRDQLFLV